MENNTELLLEILEEEYEAYDSLEEMLHEEREILMKPKLNEFEEQMGNKAQLVTQIHRLELERSRLMSLLASELGIDGENCKLLDLMKNVPPEQAGRAKELRERLKRKIEVVNKESEGNQWLVDNLLSVMNGVMDSVKSVFAEPATYGLKGTLGDSRINGGGIVSQSV